MNLSKMFNKLLVIIILFSSLYARNNKEFRATWVITWEHLSDSTKIKKILDNHVEANMNAVLYQVRQGGTAYYRSSYEPWGKYAGYSDPGYDPLTFVIKEAHKRGLELHAWFNTFHTSDTVAGTPVAEHPEWVCRDGNGNPMTSSRALSPGLKEVRDYTLKVAMEIVRNYDIDGFHLDYIRWNEYSTSTLAKKVKKDKYYEGLLSRAELENLRYTASKDRYLYDINHKYSDGVPEGFDSWEEWWRWSVTEFVKTLHDSIQAEKPWVRLSAAVLGNYRWGGWQAYNTVYQDAAKWYNNEYVDQLTPMHYHWTTGNGFYDMLAGIGENNWEYWLEDTSRALFSVGPGSYILHENDVWDNHPDIVKKSRKLDWVDGFQFFSYGSWEDYTYWEEAGATFFDKKTKIESVYQKTPPASPSVALDKVDSLTYAIYVEPEAGINKDQWFAIYRSEDETIDPDKDEIIDIAFGDSAYYYIDEFSGNQNYNGQYHYAATAFNRYWNESQSSNAVTSDSIPSLPPIVITTIPLDGDSIATEEPLSFSFSKEIDPATVADGFSIQPEVPVENIEVSDEWYNAGEIVKIHFAERLDFATTYEVTLDSDLKDKNGVSLDGDADGVAGDSYTLTFTTYSKDLVGPEIEEVNPVDNTVNLDVEQAINVIFDELLDPESVDSKTISLMSNGRKLTVEPAVTTFDNQSIVTIKPYSQLLNNGSVNLTLSSAIKDTAGNSMTASSDFSYQTDGFYYQSKQTLDNFKNSGDWWQPDGSGSTSGIIGSETSFGISRKIYLPDIANSKSGRITYKWDQESTSHFLRLHNPEGKRFDTSYTLQAYVYGDGSGTQFRFSCYEYGGNSDVAEVSKWTTIDWKGWKLVEWELSDTGDVGYWSDGLSNGLMDGEEYRLESFQMTATDSSEISGEIYVDNLRIVKKSAGQPPQNQAPVVESFNDTTMAAGDYLKIYVDYTDPNENDKHQIIPRADTSGIMFDVKGHTSGSRVYIVPENDFTGEAKVSIIVRDYGIGELADTTSFNLTVSTSDIDDEPVALQYSLSQNYPNPFNPTTKIDFTIAKPGNIRIAIYDLLGRKVAEPVNSHYKPGKYNFTFNAAELSSGVYIYRLITENKVITKKMMLLK